MKKGSTIYVWVSGILLLLCALLLGVGVAFAQYGVVPPMVMSCLLVLSRGVGFAASDSPLGLLPFVGMLFVWSGMCFSMRKKHAFSLIFLPLSALMFYTLLLFTHLLQNSGRPAFLQPLLYSFEADSRLASLRVVLAFLGEMALFVILTLIGDSLQSRALKNQAFDALVDRHVAGEPVDLGSFSKRQMRSFRRKVKQREQQALLAEEEEDVVLAKKPVEPEVDILADDVQVSFPPIADVPVLNTLYTGHSAPKKSKSKEKSSHILDQEESPLTSLGVVSVGALQAIKQEKDRNQGLSYMEVKQRELQKKKEEQQKQEEQSIVAPKNMSKLSGFLQGALEAVGKAPVQPVQPKVVPTGKARGMLAEAVATKEKSLGLEAVSLGVKMPTSDATESDQPLKIRERILSVRPPQYESAPVEEELPPAPTPPSVVEHTPPPVEGPVKQGISSFAPQSTARPINGGSSVDAPPPVEEPTDEQDLLEIASGVGGLVANEGGSSALLNRARITYQYPPESILVTYPKIGNEIDEYTLARGEVLVATLQQFNVRVELNHIVRGPTVTMFEILPAAGVRVNSIVTLSDNIAMALAAKQVRIVAPIPGKSAVGIEIPNEKRDIIGFREMLPSMDSKPFNIPMVLGKNLMGSPVVMDVSTTPHLLIAGSTGSGKSVCVNSMICSILYRRSPKEVRLILVDPKIVELSIYNGIPHLLTPVIHDPKKTLKAFDFCLYEMDRRYRLLQGINARNILGYNEKITKERLAREKLPYIVVVIDEFADLMHTVGKELENKVSRLAAMSRAVGIHLVLATQRPSVDVITGVIKTNIPTRIAFAVTSTTDSRIIIDEGGAEKLLGRGDMLYLASSDPVPERIQGAFLSDREVEEVVNFASKQGVPDFIDDSFFEDDEPVQSSSYDGGDSNDDESLMEEALAIVVERKSASASYLQRRLKIGYNRAARLIEQMEEMGYVGPPNGSKPRELLKYP